MEVLGVHNGLRVAGHLQVWQGRASLALTFNMVYIPFAFMPFSVSPAHVTTLSYICQYFALFRLILALNYISFLIKICGSLSLNILCETSYS